MPDIQAMPNGDATRITDGGDNLSGGQRARVSLARTLYAHSDIYLLDNCLAALDGTVACCVLRSLRYSPLMSHATVIMTSSHPPSIAAADFVITMEHGRVASVAAQSEHARAPAANCTFGVGETAALSKPPSALARISSTHDRGNVVKVPHVRLEDAWEQCLTARDRWEMQHDGSDGVSWVGAAAAGSQAGRCDEEALRGLCQTANTCGSAGSHEPQTVLTVDVPSSAMAIGKAVPVRGISPPQVCTDSHAVVFDKCM